AITKEFKRYTNDQAICRWDTPEVPRMMRDMRVGVMGLGALGAATATLLARTGFPTAGWSRSVAGLPGVESYAGAQQLPDFLARTDILVCLLPGTEVTRGIRSEEHTSELQSRENLVCRLLLGLQNCNSHILFSSS